MRSNDKLPVPNEDTKDRSSTGITHPPLIPVGSEYPPGIFGTAGYVVPPDGDSPDQHRASPLSASRLMVEGEFMRVTSGGPEKDAVPDVNWLVVLGEG